LHPVPYFSVIYCGLCGIGVFVAPLYNFDAAFVSGTVGLIIAV